MRYGPDSSDTWVYTHREWLKSITRVILFTWILQLILDSYVDSLSPSLTSFTTRTYRTSGGVYPYRYRYMFLFVVGFNPNEGFGIPKIRILHLYVDSLSKHERVHTHIGWLVPITRLILSIPILLLILNSYVDSLSKFEPRYDPDASGFHSQPFFKGALCASATRSSCFIIKLHVLHWGCDS